MTPPSTSAWTLTLYPTLPAALQVPHYNDTINKIRIGSYTSIVFTAALFVALAFMPDPDVGQVRARPGQVLASSIFRDLL